MAIQRSVLVTKAQELMKNEGLDHATAAKKARDLTNPAIQNQTVQPTGGATLPIAPTVTQQTTPTTQPIAKAGDVVVGVGGEKFVQANNYDGSTNVQGQGQVVNQSGQALNQMQQIQAESFGRREGANISPIAPREAPINNTVSGGVTPTTPTSPTAPTPSTPTTKPSDFMDFMKGKDEYGPDGRKVIGYRSSYGGPGSEISSADRIPVYEGDQYTPPLNADMMFSSIVMKAPVPDDQKTTTQYKIAQNRYLKANSYASMTPAQVSSDITSGKLIEGSQTYEDIKALNPKLIQDTNNLRIVNGSKVSLYDENGNNNVDKTFAEDYLGNFGTFLKSLFTVQTPEQINAAIKTQDVKDAEAKATEYESQLIAIENDMDIIEETARKELEGTGASADRIRLEIGIRKDQKEKEYNAILRKYTQFANKANNLITQNTTVYQEQMKQTTAQQQALAGAAGQVFSSQLAIQQKQAEFEQGLAQQAQAASDPTTAISGVLNQFAKLGITANLDVAGHMAAFKASGLTLPEYTAKMIQDFKAKPEYQKAMSLQMGQLSDAQKMQLGYQQDINKMAIGNQYDLTKMGINNQQDIQKLMLNYNLGNQKDIQSSKIDLMGKGFTPDQADAIVRTATGNWKGATGETLLSAPDSTIIPSRLSETTNPNGGKECGEYVNDIVGSGTVGSTWASKSSKIDSSITVPTVGNTAVWIPDPNNPDFAQYGHAGIVTAVNGDITTGTGTVTIKSSNYNGQGEISTITVPISEITKTGGFIGTAIKGPGKTTGLGKDDVKNINGLYDDLKGIDTFKNWKAISSQVTWFNDLKNKELNGSDIQGLITNYAKVLDPTSVVRESEFAMAQKGANQGAIDRAKTSIATYLNGGSAVLSKEAQEALKSAMGRRFDAVKEAYVNEVDAQVARGKQMGMPVTWENLTGESRDSYTKGTQPTQGNLVISKEAALDLFNKWKKANQQ